MLLVIRGIVLSRPETSTPVTTSPVVCGILSVRLGRICTVPFVAMLVLTLTVSVGSRASSDSSRSSRPSRRGRAAAH